MSKPTDLSTEEFLKWAKKDSEIKEKIAREVYVSQEDIENALLSREAHEKIHRKDKYFRCKIGWHKLDGENGDYKRTCELCGVVYIDDDCSFGSGGPP